MAKIPTRADLEAFFTAAFEGPPPNFIALGEGRAAQRLAVTKAHLRPGGYVSGPTQMQLADTVTYAAIFTRIGIEPMAVTTSLNMSFLRPLIGEVVIAEAQLMKLGRTLAIAEVTLKAEGESAPASHAVVTYALPRKS
ncbi:MAG: PaaI family thioesterase [Pseudomonadota bacterium]